MANLLPQNSQYVDSSGPSKFPALSKAVQGSSPISASAPHVSAYAPAPKYDLANFYKGMDTFPAEKAIIPSSGKINEPVPTGYSSFLAGQKTPGGQDMWVTPSEKTYIRNYPEALGGGQYAVDPTQSGAIVKSSRGYDPKETILLRGGLSPYDAQIDHIIPLNMGGVDTLSNKQILSTAEHEQKTKAQAVALTLLAQGKINTEEAKFMTLNWKTYDVEDLPMPDAFGYITNMSPEKAALLTNAGTQQAKNEYYKALGLDNAAIKAKEQWDFDVQHPKGTYGHSLGDSIKAVWKEIPNSMNTVLGHSIGGEFAKGLVEGGSAGLIHAAPEEEKKNFGQIAARIAGNAIGTFVPIGLFARGVGLTARVLSKTPGLSRVFAGERALVKALPMISGAADTERAIATIAPESIGQAGRLKNAIGKINTIFSESSVGKGASKVSQTLGKINRFGKAKAVINEASAVDGVLGLQQFPMALNKFTAAGLKYGPLARNAAFFGSYGVATQLLREGMGVQDESDFLSHAGTFVTDAITGGIMGSANQTFSGYAKIAAPAMILSYMNGESPEDAFANAVTMVGLHGMGSAKMQRMGLTRDVTKWGSGQHEAIIKPSEKYEDVIASEMNRVANESAKEILWKWVPESMKGDNIKKFPNLQEKLEQPTQKKAPKESKNLSETMLNQMGKQSTEQVPTGIYTPKQLEQIQEKALTRIEQKAHDENWTPRQLDAELLKVMASVRQLDKGGMGALVRNKADIADVKSSAQKLQTATNIQGIVGDPVPMHVYEKYGGKDPVSLSPVDFNEKPSGDFSAVGIFPVTAYGSTIPGGTRSNVEIFEKAVLSKEAPYGDNILLIDRGADYKNHMEILNKTAKPEDIASGKFTPFKNPQNTVEAVGAVRDPRTGDINFLHLGFVARESRIQKMNDQVNLEGLIEYDKFNNKDTLNQGMRDNGVTGVWGRQVPLKTGLMSIANKDKTKVPEYHLRVAITDGRWRDAGAREAEVKSIQSGTPESTVAATTDTIPTQTQVTTPSIPTQGKLTLPELISQKVKPMAPKKVESPSVEVKTTKAEPTEVKPEVTTPKTEEQSVEKEQSIKPKWRNFIVTERGQEGVNTGAASYIKTPGDLKSFTRKNLTKIAKEASGDGSDIKGGWPTYLETVTNKIRESTGNPDFSITNKNELRDLSWSYKHLANAGTRREIVLKAGDDKITLKEGTNQNIGQLDKDIQQYNKEHGLPDGSMEIVHVAPKNIYEGVKNSLDSRNIFDYTNKELQRAEKNGFVPMGIIAKGSDSVVYLKKEPQLIDAFNKNPNKYLNEGEKVSDFTPEDKFIRAFAVDVAKWPKEATSGDFVKRANLNTHRYDVSTEEGTAKIHILKAKTIGDEPNLNIQSDKFETPKGEKAKKATESFLKGSEIDGKLVIGEKLFDRLVKGFDYDPSKHETGLKPLISGMIKGKDGAMIKMIQKGHAIKADPALRNMLESEYGLNLGPDEIASFDTNAKVGPKGDTHEINISDIFSKPLGVGNEGRAKASLERKFLSSDPNVTKDMLAETAKRRKDFEAFNEEAMSANSKDKLEAVIDKYAERYDLDKDTLFYGPLGEAFNLGAAKINLSHNLEKISKNLFMETVLSDTIPNSGRVFYSPSIKLPLDGANKPLRYAKDDEIVLGEEFMKKRNMKEGDRVIILRDPSYDINNVTVAHVRDGSKLGHTSLGMENGIVSHFNERVIHQADQDGDKMLVIKVGENGAPESYADAIEKRGKLATPFTEVNVTKSGYITSKNINEVIRNQLVGDDQTSKISIVNRVMDTVKDNDLSIVVYPTATGKMGKAKYEIFSNGKVVDSGDTFSGGQGFTATPRWGEEERQLRSQALQEALDSKKSLDIVKRSENNNPVWMLKQAFVDESGNKITDIKAQAVNGALSKMQKIFNIDNIAEGKNNLDDVFKELQPSIEMIGNMKQAGTKLTPYQEKILSLGDIKTFRIPDEVRLEADKLGGLAVKKQLSDISLSNPKLQEIIRRAKNTKIAYHRLGVTSTQKKEIKKELEEYFLDNLDRGNYSQSEIDSIARWAATSDLANISFNNLPEKSTGKPRFSTPKYAYRFNSLINASPRVAKVYLEGSEGYEAPAKTSETSKYANLSNAIKKQP